MSESYFKIPIERLLDKLVINEHNGIKFNNSQWDMASGLDEHRFWVHISARRTGKSLGASVLAFAKLLEPRQQVMVVAPNFSLSSIIWDFVTDIIKNLQIEVERFNQKDKISRNDRPIILSISRLSPQKNHHLIIKAVKDLDVNLRIIGD